MPGNQTEMEGEVYYPSRKSSRRPTPKIGTNSPSPPAKTCKASGQRSRRTGMVPEVGSKCWTIRTSHSTSGSPARKSTSSTTAIDRHLKTPSQKQAGADLGKRRRQSDRTYSYYAINREVNRMANMIKAMGVQKRRPRHDLYGPRARDRLCHAGLRQDRRDPLGGLRRLLGRGAARPHRGQRSRSWSSPAMARC